MKELVAHLARSLAGRPQDVLVTEKPGDREILLELIVAEEDLNHLIGKQGRTIKAMRALLTAASARSGHRYFLKIAGEGNGASDSPANDAFGAEGEDNDGEGNGDD